MRPLLLAVPLFAVACAKNDGVPAWAFDPIWIEPTESGIHGFHTWELYTEDWEGSFSDRAYVCGIAVEIEGQIRAAGSGCQGCDDAWAVTGTLVESDCDSTITENAGFLSIAGVALGPVGAGLTEDDPYPGQTLGGYVDYGDGTWEPHGWAYPQEFDITGPEGTATWDGAQPFQLWPAFAWEL